jgi:hypothetical protein
VSCYNGFYTRRWGDLSNCQAAVKSGCHPSHPTSWALHMMHCQMQVAEETSRKIEAASQAYRPCSVRASVLYFVLNDLALIDPMYQVITVTAAHQTSCAVSLSSPLL